MRSLEEMKLLKGGATTCLRSSAAQISSIFVSIVSKNTLKVSPGLPLFKCLRSTTRFGSSPIMACLIHLWISLFWSWEASPVSSVYILQRTCFGTVMPWIFDTLWLKVRCICLVWNTDSDVSISLNMPAPIVKEVIKEKNWTNSARNLFNNFETVFLFCYSVFW